MKLTTIIMEDLQSHREGIFAQGFWALLVYRFGHARFKYKSKFIRTPWGALHLILHKFIEITCGISIGVNAKIGRRLQIEHFGQIIIHGECEIGDDCMIRQGVTLGNKSKTAPLDAPKIGSGVDIGAGAKILGALTIGNGSTIGANSVVTKDVAPFTVVAGAPARIIRILQPHQLP